jgi:hypothetical protein
MSHTNGPQWLPILKSFEPAPSPGREQVPQWASQASAKARFSRSRSRQILISGNWPFSGSDYCLRNLNGRSSITRSLDFYLSNINFMLSCSTQHFISLRTAKVHSIFQCAFLIAQEIACKLEQKKSFRFICRLIFQKLATCRYIKGIRISCSGRLNGAEIAKTECRKFGETSLHVFSDKIDYAQARASTTFGILGIKVWISYI